MNIFNKYEAFGIFVSVAIMAIALASIRFKTDTLTQALDSDAQQATVVVADGEKQTETEKLDEVKQALMDASTNTGKLIKLVIDDVEVGSGTEVKRGDTITVHYKGTLQDGTKFDSSYERGEPFTFTIGEGRVIQGWEEGFIGMKVGGERILVIPSEMAYGNRQVGVIPPNSPLVFSVKLLKIE